MTITERWLTNHKETAAEDYIRQLTAGQPNRVIVARDPKPTAQYGVEKLKEWGLVGLYEAEPTP